jgi:hypothetical protein
MALLGHSSTGTGLRSLSRPDGLTGFFWAWRCFLSEVLRMMFALAARIASALVGCFFAAVLQAGTFFTFDPAMGIAGSICMAAVRWCATGCMAIGMSGIFLAMADNAFGGNSFEIPNALHDGKRPRQGADGVSR